MGISLKERINELNGLFSNQDLAFFNIVNYEVEKGKTLQEKVWKALRLMEGYEELKDIVFEFYLKGDDDKVRCVYVIGESIERLDYLGRSVIGKVTEALEKNIVLINDKKEIGLRKEFVERNKIKNSRYYPIGGCAVLVASKIINKEFTKHEVGLIEYSLKTFLGNALISMLKYKELLDLAVKDGLTGLYNRRYFEEKLEKCARLQERTGNPLSLILIDIDYFKKVNDTHGHLVGDKVLKDLSKIILNTARQDDTVARYGGEEIVIILESTSKIKAMELAVRILNAVNEYGSLYPEYSIKTDKVWPISCSLGIASLPEDASTKEELVKATDIALYGAKNSGRGRVYCYNKMLMNNA